MDRYLITGAQGYVGRYLGAHLLYSKPGAEIFGIGRSPRNDNSFTHSVSRGDRLLPAPLPLSLRVDGQERYHYLSVDIRNTRELTEVLEDVVPDVIFHMASGLRDDAPEKLCQTNVEGTVSLVEALAQSKSSCSCVVFGSSGGVYGVPGAEGLPFNEDASCNPIDLYTATKLASEQLSSLLTRTYRIPAIWARIFNIMGPGQDERHICGRLAAQVIAMMQGEIPPHLTVGNLDSTRDFIDVRDVVRALDILSNKGEPHNIYNVASGTETSIHTILKATIRLAGASNLINIEQKNLRRSDISRHFAHIGKLVELDFSPKYSMDCGISDLLSYYRTMVFGNEK